MNAIVLEIEYISDNEQTIACMGIGLYNAIQAHFICPGSMNYLLMVLPKERKDRVVTYVSWKGHNRLDCE
mgnify:CR=1 FL=1|jgi:hypothetical protein